MTRRIAPTPAPPTLRSLHAAVVVLAEEHGLVDHSVTVTVEVASSCDAGRRAAHHVSYSASVQAPNTYRVVAAARWKTLIEIVPFLRTQLVADLMGTSTDILDEAIEATP